MPEFALPDDVTFDLPDDVSFDLPDDVSFAAGDDYRAMARQVAQETGIDPDLFERQIKAESNFDPRAVSSVGAQGLAQFMPATWKEWGGGQDPFDPEASLRAGAAYYKHLLDRYQGDERLALAAYNSGMGNVDKYGGVPPFEETQGYVKKIYDDWVRPVNNTAVARAATGAIPEDAKEVGFRAAEPSAFEEYIEFPARRGQARLKQQIRDLTVDYNDENSIRRYALAKARLAREYEAAAPGTEQEDLMQEFMEADWTDQLKMAVQHPSILGTVGLESFVNFAPGAVAVALAAPVAGPVGTALGVGSSSFAIEYGSTLSEVIEESGLDNSDPQAWARALQDKKLVAEARSRAAKRGVPIAAVDALTAGLAGRILAGAKEGILSPLLRVVGEIAFQMAGGATGEVAGQVAEKGQVTSTGDIILEAGAEAPTAAIEVPANYRTAKAAAAATAERRLSDELQFREVLASGDAESIAAEYDYYAGRYGTKAADAIANPPASTDTTANRTSGKATDAEAAAVNIGREAVAEEEISRPESPMGGSDLTTPEGRQAAINAEMGPGPVPMETPAQETPPAAQEAPTPPLAPVVPLVQPEETPARPVNIWEAPPPTSGLRQTMQVADGLVQMFLQQQGDIATGQPTGGRPRTATAEQLDTADSLWNALQQRLQPLADEGYDTTRLRDVLRAAAGNRAATQATAASRGNRAISGRKRGVAGLVDAGRTPKNAPKGGWTPILTKFFTDARTELNRLAAEGPTNLPAGTVMLDLGHNIPATSARPIEAPVAPPASAVTPEPPPAAPVQPPAAAMQPLPVQETPAPRKGKPLVATYIPITDGVETGTVRADKLLAAADERIDTLEQIRRCLTS